MDWLLPLTGIVLLLNLILGMLRVYRGPTAADRMLAALLFGSTTVAVLLVFAEWMDVPALRDVALLFVMLAAIISVAFVGLPESDEGNP
ncbi:MAG: pH regulation protein F [Gammaproteobacteria bacterium]|nr:MAG: pH regulation protein F [Gammaproteobacteria bacterium]